MRADFPHLDHLIKAYFHQDYDLIAGDIEGLMSDFVQTSARAEREGARSDIERYLATHRHDLDQAFRSAYGFDVDPQLWGLSTEGFVRKLAGLLT
jgi:CdiI immunity protein